MSNTLKAILNIVADINITDGSNINISEPAPGSNRVNHVGEGLEYFIKDAYADCIGQQSFSKTSAYENTFSYLGNTSNPPDFILKNSDAVEVKKLQTRSSSLALNSSPPKNKLYSNDPRITQACRTCETREWDEKDIVYAIGEVADQRVKEVWIIYGDCYCAQADTYLKISHKISQAVADSPDLEWEETKELARINKVDPLGITNLRVRGMWHIAHPRRVFEEFLNFDNANNFLLVSIMRLEKFKSFPDVDKTAIQANPLINYREIMIKNPDNPAQRLDAVMITVER